MANKPIEILKVKGIGTNEFLRRIKQMGTDSVLVGIPSGSKTSRIKDIRAKAKRLTSPKTKAKKKHLGKLASRTTLSNAQALRIFTEGSALSHQPPRPVLEPAIQAEGNKENIVAAIRDANKAELAGNHSEAKKLLAKAGRIARDAAKAWFFDSRNNWPENAASTMSHKGFDQPGIDSGAMRDAITFVEKGS